MRRHDIDQVVAAMAERQHRVFTFEQVRPLGVSRSMASRRTLAGIWQKPHPGVLVLGGTVLTPTGAALAAAWSLRGGRASFECAGGLLHVDDLRPTRRVEVTVARGRGQPRPFVVHEARRLPRRDTAVVDGVPCTTVTRTLVDLAGVWPPDRLAAAWTGEILAKRTSVARLERCALPLIGTGHPGTRQARLLLEQLDEDSEPPPQSVLEEMLVDIVGAGRYGPMDRQSSLLLLAGTRGRVDGYLRRVDTVVEVDGRRWHGRVADFERDHARDNALQAEGHHVLRFTHKQLTEDRAGVVATLERHFHVRGLARDATGLWVRAA